jgi:hypothetical protein
MPARADVAPISQGRSVATRPAILEALRALGVPDAALADAFNVTAPVITYWAKGVREVPTPMALAATFVVGRLVGKFGKALPPDTKFARRSEMARQHALNWLELAKDELPLLSVKEVQLGYKLGKRALRRIEKREAM